VVVKPGKHNGGLDYLLRIESGEVGGSLDDEILDAQIFKVEAVSGQLVEITTYIIIGKVSEGYT
jgi:hypothetical protein